MQNRLKYRLGWLEAGLYLGGLALLAAFFLQRLEGERQREAGIAAFASALSQEVTIRDAAAGEHIAVTLGAPDQSLWAENRIHEYETSLAVEAEPPLAVMRIDRLGLEVPVYDGADDLNLNRGVGRIKGTAAVDDDGNLGIAGHRDGFFRVLKDIEIGDEVDLLTPAGQTAYAVSSIEIVDPDDVWVLNPTEGKTVTLVTCYPFYYVGHAPKRFIVKAMAEHHPATTE
jgi:sortase A